MAPKSPQLKPNGTYSDLRQVLLRARTLDLNTRAREFEDFWQAAIDARASLYFREVLGPADREVRVRDPFTGEERRMLMFGSNNYLGMANDPWVAERVRTEIEKFGTGLAGPALLNGYTTLLRSLEERLAALKGTESAVVFPNGYQTNLALVGCLMDRDDLILYDESHHASLYDGLRLSRAAAQSFPHNDVTALDDLLARRRQGVRDAFVCVEGVYSMDGDLAPLPEILDVCGRHDAWLVVDDAHGTGVLGEHGRGAVEHFGLEGEVDLVMATFSKTFAAVGGFVAGPTHLLAYLRFFARPYMFSASLPPTVLAMIHGALDVMEREPWRRERLVANRDYLLKELRRIGLEVRAEAGIIPLIVPGDMVIRKAAYAFHERGIFINAIEWPAVPVDAQRFRISLMAQHTHEDLDRLVEAVREVWGDPTLREKT